MLALLSLALLQPAPTPATPADQAKAATEAFMKAFQLLNLDDIEKLVAVPWFHDGKTVIQDMKELKLDFERLLARYRGLPKVKYELRKQMAYGEVRADLEADERKMIDQVLRPEDFVQLVTITNPDTNKKETLVLFVQVKDGQAKVVGLKN